MTLEMVATSIGKGLFAEEDPEPTEEEEEEREAWDEAVEKAILGLMGKGRSYEEAVAELEKELDDLMKEFFRPLNIVLAAVLSVMVIQFIKQRRSIYSRA